MKNFLTIITCILIACIPLNATDEAITKVEHTPKKRVQFGNVIKQTDLPFLYKPYLPDKHAESRTATDEWVSTVQLCFSPSGQSDSAHQLGLWNDQLYLIKKNSTVVEFFEIDKHIGRAFLIDELPSVRLEEIRYFNNIRMFEMLNGALKNTSAALREKIRRNSATPFLRITLKGENYRVTEEPETHRLLAAPEPIKDSHIAPARPQHLIHLLLTHWDWTGERVDLFIEGVHDKKCRCAIL
jgi:hypothetical protein